MVCTSGNYINAMEVEEEINTNNITNNQQNNIVSRERIQNVINNGLLGKLEDFDDLVYYSELLDILQNNTNNYIQLSQDELNALTRLETFSQDNNNNINTENEINTNPSSDENISAEEYNCEEDMNVDTKDYNYNIEDSNLYDDPDVLDEEINVNPKTDNMKIKHRIENVVNTIEKYYSRTIDETIAADCRNLGDIIKKNEKSDNIQLTEIQLNTLKKLEKFVNDQKIKSRIKNVVGIIKYKSLELGDEDLENYLEFDELLQDDNIAFDEEKAMKLKRLEVICKEHFKNKMNNLIAANNNLVSSISDAIGCINAVLDGELSQDDRNELENERYNLFSYLDSNSEGLKEEISPVEQRLIHFIGKKLIEKYKRENNYLYTNKNTMNIGEINKFLLSRVEKLKEYLTIAISNSDNHQIYQMFLNQLNSISTSSITYNQLNILYIIELYMLLYPTNNTPPSNNEQFSTKHQEVLQNYKQILEEYEQNESNIKNNLLDIESFLNIIDSNNVDNILENFNSNVKINNSTLMSLLKSNNNSQLMQIKSQIKLIREKLNEYKTSSIYKKEQHLSQLHDEFNKIKQNYNIYLYYQLLINHKDTLSEFISKLLEHHTQKNETFLRWLLSVAVKTLNNQHLVKYVNELECSKAIREIVKYFTNNLSNEYDSEKFITNLINDEYLSLDDINKMLKIVLQDKVNKLVSETRYVISASQYKLNSNSIVSYILSPDETFISYISKLQLNEYRKIYIEIENILSMMSIVYIKELLDDYLNMQLEDIRVTRNILYKVSQKLYGVITNCIVNTNDIKKSPMTLLPSFMKFFKIKAKIKKALNMYQNLRPKQNITKEKMQKFLEVFDLDDEKLLFMTPTYEYVKDQTKYLHDNEIIYQSETKDNRVRSKYIAQDILNNIKFNNIIDDSRNDSRIRAAMDYINIERMLQQYNNIYDLSYFENITKQYDDAKEKLNNLTEQKQDDIFANHVLLTIEKNIKECNKISPSKTQLQKAIEYLKEKQQYNENTLRELSTILNDNTYNENRPVYNAMYTETKKNMEGIEQELKGLKDFLSSINKYEEENADKHKIYVRFYINQKITNTQKYILYLSDKNFK